MGIKPALVDSTHKIACEVYERLAQLLALKTLVDFKQLQQLFTRKLSECFVFRKEQHQDQLFQNDGIQQR